MPMNVAVSMSTSRLAHLLACTVVAVSMLGTGSCTTPLLPEYPGYLERAQSRTLGDLRISAAVLSDQESKTVYGVPLANRRIQPVWVQVENKTSNFYWLLYPGLDPNFFPASEAADAMASDKRDLGTLEQYFRELSFTNPVPPGRTVSGFVLTNLKEGMKLLQIDLFSDTQSRSTSFLAVVPGLRIDYETKKTQVLTDTADVDYADDAAFRAALEALPCCTTNNDASKNGDPLNLVIVGDVTDAVPALIRRGWSMTETTWSGSIIRMVNSALAGESYPYAPVSNLYLYGRPQDIALQKARDNIHQRNHLRLWRSPMRYRDRPVWVGQISRDIGSRMTIHSPTLTTHKIDPDVDEAARALLEDVVYSQALQAWGRVAGVGAVAKSAPRENLTTDPYYTIGSRLVLVFNTAPRSLTDITFLPWEGGKGFIGTAAPSNTP
jgi:hypothetical protein